MWRSDASRDRSEQRVARVEYLPVAARCLNEKRKEATHVLVLYCRRLESLRHRLGLVCEMAIELTLEKCLFCGLFADQDCCYCCCLGWVSV